MNWMNELTAEFEKTFIRDDRYKAVSYTHLQ